MSHKATVPDPKPAIEPSARSFLSILVWVLLGAQFVLLGWSAWCHSPTTLEVSQVPAGLYHWRTGKFDVAVVNPPLVRLVASTPLLCLGASCDFEAAKFGARHRPERAIGRSFVEQNGPDVFWMFTIARWMCIPFVLLGGYVVGLWARELYGAKPSVVAVATWVVCPWVLGHGALGTTDVASAALGVSAAYLFWRWQRLPSWPSALVAGFVIGVMLVSKFSLLILIPVLCGQWLFTTCRASGMRFQCDVYHVIGMAVVSAAVINASYGFDGIMVPLGKIPFVSKALTTSHAGDPAAAGNRFSGTLVGRCPMPIPREYLVGLDLQKRDFERGLASYAYGEWRNRGWWWYYLFALAVKTPIGVLGLYVMAAASCVVLRVQREELLPLACAASVLVALSFQTGFGVHGRYILPALPFLYIFVSRLMSESIRHFRVLRIASVTMLAAAAVESACIYPHSLSFFNIAFGGPSHGYRQGDCAMLGDLR